uniref:Uncharacterized protein n=1 Tax=Mustela putorius furo TaxID=9669 RepID=M3YDP8_MUSPF
MVGVVVRGLGDCFSHLLPPRGGGRLRAHSSGLRSRRDKGWRGTKDFTRKGTPPTCTPAHRSQRSAQEEAAVRGLRRGERMPANVWSQSALRDLGSLCDNRDAWRAHAGRRRYRRQEVMDADLTGVTDALRRPSRVPGRGGSSPLTISKARGWTRSSPPESGSARVCGAGRRPTGCLLSLCPYPPGPGPTPALQGEAGLLWGSEVF